MNVLAARLRNSAARMRRAQRGVGMIELMVAMVLGAMVVLGVIQVFTANRQTFRMQDGMAITQEAGTFAVDFIGRDVLRGGLNLSGAAGDDYAFNLAATVDGGPGGNDTIAVIYAPENRLDGVILDCTGVTVDGALFADDVLVRNVYSVNADGELVCQGSHMQGGVFVANGPAQVLVDNVESFQILYGVNTDVVAGCNQVLAAPTMYVPASQIATVVNRWVAACGVASAPETSFLIRAVRIGLLLRSENPAGTLVDAGRRYDVLDESVGAPEIDPADGRLRRLFARTLLLRNSAQVQNL